jgi:hypothetical protein
MQLLHTISLMFFFITLLLYQMLCLHARLDAFLDFLSSSDGDTAGETDRLRKESMKSVSVFFTVF